MPLKTLLGQWEAMTNALLAMLPTTVLARLLYHRRLVAIGRRRMWSIDLVWELPTAMLCAIVASGLAQYLDLSLTTACALAGAVGWMGPRGIEAAIQKYIPPKGRDDA